MKSRLFFNSATKEREAERVYNKNMERQRRPQRVARMEALRARMGFSMREFAALLAISEKGYRRIVSSKSCSGAYVKLADIEYARWYMQQYGLKHSERVKMATKIPQKIRDSVEIRTGVLKLYMQGRSTREIAEELALRPGVVEYFIQLVR